MAGCSKNLNTKTRVELYECAKHADIKNRSKMNKEQLLNALLEQPKLTAKTAKTAKTMAPNIVLTKEMMNVDANDVVKHIKSIFQTLIDVIKVDFYNLHMQYYVNPYILIDLSFSIMYKRASFSTYIRNTLTNTVEYIDSALFVQGPYSQIHKTRLMSRVEEILKSQPLNVVKQLAIKKAFGRMGKPVVKIVKEDGKTAKSKLMRSQFIEKIKLKLPELYGPILLVDSSDMDRFD